MTPRSDPEVSDPEASGCNARPDPEVFDPEVLKRYLTEKSVYCEAEEDGCRNVCCKPSNAGVCPPNFHRPINPPPHSKSAPKILPAQDTQKNEQSILTVKGHIK